MTRDQWKHRIIALCGYDLRPLEDQFLDAVFTGKQTSTHARGLGSANHTPPLIPPPDSRIRACTLNSLLVDKTIRDHVPLHGIWLSGAHIEGNLNLRSAVLPFPLVLLDCFIPDTIELRDAHTQLLKFSGSHTGSINASRLVVESSLALNSGFWAKGTINLHGARISGVLDCRDSRFDPEELPSRKPGTCHRQGFILRPTFAGDDMKIGSDAYFTNVLARGGVVLTAAEITDDLQLQGSFFDNPAGKALDADRITVGGNVLMRARDTTPQCRHKPLRSFSARGVVSLVHAQIGADLFCRSVKIGKPRPSTRTAIKTAYVEPASEIVFDAREARIGGSGFFDDQFWARGRMNFVHASVGGNLFFSGAHVSHPRDGQIALDAREARVTGSAFFDHGFKTNGIVRFAGGSIKGGLYFNGARFYGNYRTGLNAKYTNIRGTLAWVSIGCKTGSLQLDLRYARVGHFQDDEGSWPPSGNLLIDGFTYGDLANLGEEKRTKWLKLQLCKRFPGDHINYNNLAAQLSTRNKIASRFQRMMLDEDLRWISSNRSHGPLPKAQEKVGKLSKIDERELLIGLNLLLNDKHPPGRKKRGATNYKVIKAKFPNAFEGWSRPFNGYFKPQPYEQLAFFLLNHGNKSESIRLLIKKEDTRLRFSHQETSWLLRGLWCSWRGFLRLTAAYGYKPYWAGMWSILIIATGTCIFGAAREYQYMVPAKEYVYAQWTQGPSIQPSTTRPPEEQPHGTGDACEDPNVKRLPAEYPEFNAFTYSLDVFLPVVDLHQQTHWIPSDVTVDWRHCGPPPPETHVEQFTRWIMGGIYIQPEDLHTSLWLEIIAGWALSTIFFAGLFGFLHTSELHERPTEPPQNEA